MMDEIEVRGVVELPRLETGQEQHPDCAALS